jgi:hypothetical protein
MSGLVENSMRMEMEECGLGLLSAIVQYCISLGVPQMDDAGPARLAWSRSHFSEDQVKEGRILKRNPILERPI